MNILDKHSDSELNSLDEEQIVKIKKLIWADYDKDNRRTLSESGAIRIVSEGDSWFNYSYAGFDIIDYLADSGDYSIIRHATPGDTLENMVYGTDYRPRTYNLVPPQFEDVIRDIKNYGPRIFLFSGGGNDIAGPELESLLNHKESGLEPLRSEYLDYLVNVVFKSAFKSMIDTIWSIDSEIHIITHGYAYATPSGKGVGRILGFNFIGPWLRPVFTKKRITSTAEQERIIKLLIDSFNDMLFSIAGERDNFHIVDLRPEFNDEDWANEMHLKNTAFKHAAAKFAQMINEITTADA